MQRFRTYVLLLILSVLLYGCRSERTSVTKYDMIEGQTMGTIYNCIYAPSPGNPVSKPEVDSILILINDVASTYISTSLISKINSAHDGYCLKSTQPQMAHFMEIFDISDNVYKASKGFFDPTLMPLVNYWGFGYKNKQKRTAFDKQELDSLLRITGFNRISIQQVSDSTCILKSRNEMELDFSAVAKGYAVDILSDYFEFNNCQNYYINIGGEIVVRGKNREGENWKLGINYPDTSAALNELYGVLELENGALASSGNYRNFYSSSGEMRAHTINPTTGLAQPSDLLSATILAPDCATADAYATACMAMGYDRARQLVDSVDGLSALLIHLDSKKDRLEHFISPALKNKINITK